MSEARHPATTETEADVIVERFGTFTPSFVRLDAEAGRAGNAPAAFQLGTDGTRRRPADTALGQAVVTIGGALQYDVALEVNARAGDAYQFRSSFTHIKEAFDASDLTIAGFTSVVDDAYPPLALARGTAADYANARSEYLEGIAYGGIDCLAAAHPRNLSLGVRGVVATERSARDRGIALAGLGEHRTAVFEVNGIVVAVVSYSLDMRDRETRITPEGAEALLSPFVPTRAAADIGEAKRRGADFVIGMLNCQGAEAPYGAGARRDAGIALAEQGADYVVCNRPGTVSAYLRHRTRDGREVPVATSLGTLMSGATRASGYASALLRLTLRAVPGTSVEVEDAYIPVLRVPYHAGASTPAIALPEGSRARREHDRAEAISELVAERLGDGIGCFEQRRVTLFNHYQPQATPRELAKLLGTELTEADAQAASADERLPRLAARVEDLAEGCAAFVDVHPTAVQDMTPISPEAAREAGARIAVARRQVAGVPTLLVDDTWSALMAAAQDIRDRFDPLVVAVTGTAGKTTTKDLIGTALSAGMPTLHLQGNANTPATLCAALQKLRTGDRAYVQEVNEGTPGAARLMSEMIRPRISVITSIADGHLDQMGTIDNVIDGATDVVRGMPDDGVLVVNNDNEHLKRLTFPVRTVRCGIDDPECDVYARDVELGATQTTFTIVDGESALPARIEVPGAHNVRNALVAYAAAREAGVPAHRVTGALSTFRSNGVRQHLVEHGGFHLLIDTYNSSLLALRASLEVLGNIGLAPGARRIAVLGDMGEQGGKVEQNHREAGRSTAEAGVDILLCTGEGMAIAAEEARRAGVEVMHAASVERLTEIARDTMRTGDAVLFKAAGAEEFAKRVVAPLFGTIS